MENDLKKCKEKLKGTWGLNCGIYDDNDALGLYVTEFNYSGEDGEFQPLKNSRFTGDVKVYITISETGKSFLCVKCLFDGLMRCTLGEIAFTEDNNGFSLLCNSSRFFYERIGT